LQKDKGKPRKSKTIAFSLSLPRGTVHATSECQTEVRENEVSK